MTESAEKNFPAYSHLPKYSPEGLKHDGNQVLFTLNLFRYSVWKSTINSSDLSATSAAE